MAGSIQTAREIWMVGDFRPHMPEVTGVDCLVQRLVRRLSTPHGFFPWWPNEGLDIRQYLLSKTPLWQIGKAVEEECRRDEQVDDVVADVTYTGDGKGILVKVFITTALGPFTFTMDVSAAAVTLLALEAAA